MAHLKRSIVQVTSETNCLAHALIIAVARATKDPNYAAYRKGRKIYPRVDQLLAATGINLDNGGGIPELERFQDHFRHYKIVVYTGLNCDDIMFEGRVDAVERLNLLYDEVTRHYHVIGNLTAAMAKRYVCTACGTGCRRDVTHTCDQTCSSCMASPPCVATGVRIPCADCARHFRSQICFANHKRRIGNRRAVCERKRNCVTCGELIVSDKPHECGKHYCDVCTSNREVGHLCYMQPLKNVLPSSDGVLYVFYDFETTQNTRYSETAKVHVPNLVCIQQFCSRCEGVDDSAQDCERCGIRKHSFWEDPVGDLLTYLCEPRPGIRQIIAIAHNAKAFDLHFILSRAVQLKWRPELVMSGQKIILMKMEHIKFIDSISFLPFPLRKLSAAFGLTAAKGWYPHYFNTEENLDYVGSIPDTSYYGIDEMSAGERKEFLE